MDLTDGSVRPATAAAYFEGCWERSDDPWEHATRWYERRKYRLTVEALPRSRYRRCFEPGSGTGLLTCLLASRVDALVAMERHPRGAAATRRRCDDLPNVRAVTGEIPGDWPDGRFDLIVLSELLYYLDAPALHTTLDRAAGSLEPDGHLVAVHYRPDVEEHAWNGDEIHDWLLAQRGWAHGTRILDEDFVLDVFAPGESDPRA
ncbi:SAM-dependent methyltransferase [soil metagenome]